MVPLENLSKKHKWSWRTWEIDLPCDVEGWIEIVARIPSPSGCEVSKVARTCHFLHTAACTELLRRDVYLRDTKELPSFYKFITTHIVHIALLRRLFLQIDRCKKFRRHSGLLAQIITSCGWVEELTLERGYLLDANPDIGKAICGLLRLRKLHISWIGGVEHALPTLTNLKSPYIQYVNLEYYCFADHERPDTDRDPSDGLHGYASSVKTLDLAAASLRVPNPYSPVCPHLTELELTECEVHSIAFLMHAFPNLHRLILNDTCIYGSLMELDAQDRRFAARVVPWKILHYLDGPADVVADLQIPCPVRYWCVAPPYGRSNIDELLAALNTITPTQLDLSLTLGGSGEFERFIREANGHALTHLSLQLGVRGLTEDQIDSCLVSSP